LFKIKLGDNLRDVSLKNVVFILGDFLQNSSANAICVKKIVDQLVLEGYKISIVCKDQIIGKSTTLESNGIKVHYLSILRNRFWNAATKKKETTESITMSFFCVIILFILRVIYRVYSVFMWPSAEKWFINRTLKKLKEIGVDEKIDCIITVSMPYESHLAGYKYKRKKKEVKWITYTLDSFVHSPTLQKHFIFKHLKEKINRTSEQRVFERSDANFLSSSLKDSVIMSDKENPSKYSWISFPLLSEYNALTSVVHFETTKINIVYAGSFYKEIRNPDYCLKIFSMLNDDRILLHLFHRGDCSDLVHRYSLASKNIISYKSLPVEQVYEVENQADIFLNIGNNVGLFFPSKLVEYISFGKPIINFHDARFRYGELLDRYPYVLNIENNGGNSEEIAVQLSNFCIANKNNRVMFSELAKKFEDSTPNFITSLFIKEIENGSPQL